MIATTGTTTPIATFFFGEDRKGLVFTIVVIYFKFLYTKEISFSIR